MSTGRVDQLLAGFASGDAISREARKLRDGFLAQGMESRIFVPADSVGPNVASDCLPLGAYRGRAGDVLLYHYAIASEADAAFLSSPARKLVRYHNITPATFFRGFDDRVEAQLRDARAGLLAVASKADHVWAVSTYNATELRALGVQNVAVMPLLFSLDDFSATADAATLAELGPPLKNILFVGRMVPNKCIEELILAFAYLNRCIDPLTRLVLVGSERSCPRYFAMLKMLTNGLGLTNVCFKGFLLDGQLAACYKTASVFACASRHEGYCLPLVEAMHHGVPVIAREAGGMPEALDGGGVMFQDLEPPLLAELMWKVLSDGALRDRVLESQAHRIHDIRQRDVVTECRQVLTP